MSEIKVRDINSGGWMIVIWDNNDLSDVFNETCNSTEFRNLKKKIFNSIGEVITIQLTEPPKNEEIQEEIINTVNLIPKLENWLFNDKRLSVVCISNREDLTYSFIKILWN